MHKVVPHALMAAGFKTMIKEDNTVNKVPVVIKMFLKILLFISPT